MSIPNHEPPNILFLFPDQWRWDWLGCEQTVPVRTPNLDRLAERGVRFGQCRSNSPICAPARGCLAQGLRYHRAGVASNQYDTPTDAQTYFQLLRNAGYQVTTCGKNDLHKKTKWKGRDGWTQMLGQYGFTRAINQSGKYDSAQSGAVEKGGPHCSYTSRLHAEGAFEDFHGDIQRRAREKTGATATHPWPLPRRLHPDDFCGEMALKLLDEFPLEGPWFLWVNFPGPHDPFDPPPELQARYDGVDFPPPVNPSTTYRNDSDVDHPQIRRNYAAAIEGLDEWVGWIIDRVTQRGELDNTIIIFGSDHGEMLGDHGRFQKAVPQEGSVHVPLIVAGPGVREDAVSEALIELIDIAPTTLELAGLDVPEHYDARSFTPLLRGDGEDAAHRDVQVAQLGNWRMICDGRYKLILTEGESDELYDLAEDPGEQRNQADALPEQVEALRARLREEIGDAPAANHEAAKREAR